MPWRPIPLSYAIAIYPFQPSSSSPAELPLQIGDQLYVIEEGGKDNAWCRGYLIQQPSLLSALDPGNRGASDARVFSGIFPRCCVDVREQLGLDDEHQSQPIAPASTKPQAPVPMLKIGDESATSETEPLVDEIASCLREWYITYLPDLVLQQDYHRLDQLAEIVKKLEYLRRELLNDVLTLQERADLRSDAVWDMIRGNKLLGAEVIVRDPEQRGRLLTAQDSITEITSQQAIMSLLDEPPATKQETSRLYHCLLQVKASNETDGENVSLSFALYQKTSADSFIQLSETFTTTASVDAKTLFTDLTTRDFVPHGRLFLVVKASAMENPRMTNSLLSESLPSRVSTFRNTRDSLINRRRSNMMFTSKRKTDKPTLDQNGRVVASKPESIGDHSSQSSDDSKKKPIGPPVLRMMGYAVMDLDQMLNKTDELKCDLDLWMPATEEHEEEEIGWPGILPELLQIRKIHFVRYKKLPALTISLKSFISTDAETLIRSNPTSMQIMSPTARIGFSEAPTKRRSDIYLTISKAVIQQNGAYSHPQFGAVPVKPAPMLNLQTTMELRDSNGRRFEKCIYASSNGSAVTAVRTHAVELDHLWDQTICIRLPSDQVPDAHIVLSVADAPGFPFALAWMPLWDQRSFIKDGPHALILHAYDKSTSTFSDQGKGIYLNLPWDHSTLKQHNAVPIASIQVKTQLVSTEFSQDRILADLLKWRALSSGSLLDTLQKLFFVPEIEVVKQLDEVLDALFAILEYKAGTHKFEDLIFNNIVFVLGIVHDRRFNLEPLIERYADEHFEAPVVAPSLVRSFTRLLQSVSDPQSARDMRALFKVGKQFMRLLMASYWQQNQAVDNDHVRDKHSSFREDMRAIFFGLQMMMRSETPALVGSKTLLMQSFHLWLPELCTVYSNEDITNIAIDVVNACEEVKGKLALFRLILIYNYTKLDQLWEDEKDWNNLVENCLRWLDLYWPKVNKLTENWSDQVRLCCSIVASLLRRPIPILRHLLPTIVKTFSKLATLSQSKSRSFSSLFPTTYPFPTKKIDTTENFNEILLELTALVSEIIRIEPAPPQKMSDALRRQHISGALQIVQSILSQDLNPASWLSLNATHHVTALNILIYVAENLENHYIPEPEDADGFLTELWRSHFDTILALVTSPYLSLEKFSEQKRRAVWKIAGDIRQTGALVLQSSWEALGWEMTEDDQRRYNIRKLGGYQVQYVPALVRPVIQLCISMHEGLRRVGVHILQTMIISEWALSEDLSVIETEAIGALNSLLRDNTDPQTLSQNEIVARKLFVGDLLEAFNTIANQPDDALWTSLEDLVSTIEELIDLLSNTTDFDDNVSDNRKSNGTMKYANVELPERSISRLEGKVYGSHALECYKQLAEEYEKSGDYLRLAKTHRAMARIHETRATSRLGQRESGEVDGVEEEDE